MTVPQVFWWSDIATMVLHLLGKKSWNVYNSENVDRVRRDEAEAKAREDADEHRMQEEDAARRIAILRGETPLPPPLAHEEPSRSHGRERRHDDGVPRKRRRLRGEDDTDRDIRYAREDAEAGQKAKLALVKRDEDDKSLHDHAGNIQLVPVPNDGAIRKTEKKNAEAEAEKAKKRKRNEDQVTMRFSNAAGSKNGLERPWYALSEGCKTSNVTAALSHVPDKDVWGNEDPLRKERERNRISSSDPFAAMQQAQRQLKQSENDREMRRKEQEAEIAEMRHAEHKKRRRERRSAKLVDDKDSLAGFTLDAPSKDSRSEHRDHRRRHQRKHRGRSRSHDRNGVPSDYPQRDRKSS